jgi:hypothetical protein
MKKHISVHEGKRPLKCQLCDLTYKAKRHLNYHNSFDLIYLIYSINFPYKLVKSYKTIKDQCGFLSHSNFELSNLFKDLNSHFFWFPKKFEPFDDTHMSKRIWKEGTYSDMVLRVNELLFNENKLIHMYLRKSFSPTYAGDRRPTF